MVSSQNLKKFVRIAMNIEDEFCLIERDSSIHLIHSFNFVQRIYGLSLDCLLSLFYWAHHEILQDQ
jgi:hypothetical protein